MNGNTYAFDAETGTKLWQHKYDGAVGGGLISCEAGGQRSAWRVAPFDDLPRKLSPTTFYDDAPSATSRPSRMRRHVRFATWIRYKSATCFAVRRLPRENSLGFPAE